MNENDNWLEIMTEDGVLNGCLEYVNILALVFFIQIQYNDQNW